MLATVVVEQNEPDQRKYVVERASLSLPSPLCERILAGEKSLQVIHDGHLVSTLKVDRHSEGSRAAYNPKTGARINQRLLTADLSIRRDEQPLSFSALLTHLQNQPNLQEIVAITKSPLSRNNLELLRYLHLIPHRFERVMQGDGETTEVFLAARTDVLRIVSDPQIAKFIRKPFRLREEQVYTDAMLSEDKGTVISGSLIPVHFRSNGFPSALLTQHPDCVMVGAQVTRGAYKVAGQRPIIQNRPQYSGERPLSVWKNGEAALVVLKNGETIYARPTAQDRSAIFINTPKKEGFLNGGEFLRACPGYLDREILRPHKRAVIRNVQLDKFGGLTLGGTFFWKHKQGFENYSKAVVVWEDGDFHGVYDEHGKFLGSNPGKAADVYQKIKGGVIIWVGGEIENGRYKEGTGTAVFASPRKVPGSVIDKNPDCIITGLSANASQGSLEIGDTRVIGTLSALKGATDVTAVRKDGRFTHVFTSDGRLAYSNLPETRNAIYAATKLKAGKFTWSGFISSYQGGVPSEYPYLLPNCAIANVHADPNGSITVANRRFCLNDALLKGKKDLVCVFHNGQPTAICDSNGEILRVVNTSEIESIKVEELGVKADPKLITGLIKTFGPVHSLVILAKVFDIPGAAVVRTLKSAGIPLEEFAVDKASERERFPTGFFAAAREVLNQLPLLVSDVQWFADVLSNHTYRFIAKDTGLIKRFEEESANPENSPVLNLAYKRLVATYRGLLAIEPSNSVMERTSLFQLAGADFIRLVKRVILADECGLGKTRTTAAGISLAGDGKVMVVCPKDARGLWAEELHKTTGIPLSEIYIASGDGPPDPEELRGKTAYICHYESLRGRGNKLRSWLRENVAFDYVVVDEGQRIRNASLQSEAVSEFHAPYQIIVSATPLVGRSPKKIYRLLHWLRPELFPTEAAFNRDYGNDPVKLRDAVSTFILARRKADVAVDTPPRTTVDVTVPIEGEHAAMYQRVRSNIFEFITQRPEATKGPVALAKLHKLRMAAISPSLIEQREYAPEELLRLSGKYRKAMEIIEEAVERGEKIVVFSTNRRAVQDMEALIEARWPRSTASIIGGQAEGARQANIAAFRTDRTISVAVATSGAGGESLNLQVANNLIVLDLPWNDQEMDQIAGRIDRMDQEKPTNVYRLIGDDTVDFHLLNLLTESAALHQLFVRGDPGLPTDQEQARKVIAREFGIASDLLKGEEGELGEVFKWLEELESGTTTNNALPSVPEFFHSSIVSLIETQEARSRMHGMKTILQEQAARRESKGYFGLSGEEKMAVELVLEGKSQAEAALKTETYRGFSTVLESAMAKLGAESLSELEERWAARQAA